LARERRVCPRRFWVTDRWKGGSTSDTRCPRCSVPIPTNLRRVPRGGVPRGHTTPSIRRRWASPTSPIGKNDLPQRLFSNRNMGTARCRDGQTGVSPPSQRVSPPSHTVCPRRHNPPSPVSTSPIAESATLLWHHSSIVSPSRSLTGSHQLPASH